MPPIPTQKTPETKKSFCNQESEVESEKVELEEVDLLLPDNIPRSAEGAGETPAKKLVKKSTRIEDDKTGKRTNSAVMDKVPKKNAQRAKGSISLNKTIEKTSAELEKKRLAFDSSESISTAKEEDNVENTKSGVDGRRTPVSVRNKGSKTKTVTKKPAKKDSKDPKSKIQKPWADAMDKLSSNPLEKEITAETITKEDFAEVQDTEIHPMNPPLSTCSFFEKLQQGVKSYFSSKNSFTPYDKNKKEGGSQNSASVAKGVKEDSKKRGPGLILKNDICNSESDLFHDELRSNSNLGGQSNDFSNDKPKIFRKLKRKKLYHPKKHYVKIQIPRKGYFYRSTVQFKASGSSAPGQFERLESHDVPKSKSKIQIPRLASASLKVTNLPNKKKLKPNQENFEEDRNLGSVLSGDCFSFKYLDGLSSAFDGEKSGCNFQQKFNDYLALHWPNTNLHSLEKKKLRLKDNKILNLELKRKKQISEISEGLYRSDSQKTVNRMEKKMHREKDTFSEILAITSEKVLPSFKMQKRRSESTFETLINCINSTLGNDKLFSDLEITPINSIKGMNKTCTDPSNLEGFTETPFQFTEIISAFNNFNYSTPVENSEKPETLYLSPKISSTNFYQEDAKPIASLLEEVDLHLELENYLKGYDMFNKNKPRSAQENNFRSRFDWVNEKNNFSEIKENKSSSSFASATSNSSLEDESRNRFRVFLDRKRDMMSLSENCVSARPPRTFNMQSESADESREIRKIKSENNPRTLPQDSKLNSPIKRTFGKTSFHLCLLDDKENIILRHLSSVSKDLSSKDSVDSYEKITHFNINANKSCIDTKIKNKDNVLLENCVYSLSAESVAQRVRKIESDMNDSDIKSSDDFKIAEPFRSTLHKESPTSEMILPSNPHPVSNTSKWSPTLQDLIDIYNSLLKQNRKIRRNSKNSVNNCISSHLFTFLNEKLQEKQFKANLIRLSKNFNSNFKPQKSWKLPKKKKDSVSLKEYVAMFQEILQSSLSISQIARLNNIMSDLQDYSEKNYSFFKDLKRTVDADAETKKNVSVPEKIETPPKMETVPQPKLLSQTKPKVYFPKKSPNETMKVSKPSEKLSETKSRQTKKRICEQMKAKSKEEINEIKLSSPSELEDLLRTSFDSVDVFSNDLEKMNGKNKMLVTVKVSGNRILVDRLSYFNNEDTLSSQSIKPEETSELIIENVTRNQIPNASNKSMNINTLKYPKPSYAKESSNIFDINVKKDKATKVKKITQKKTKVQAKVKEVTSDSNSETEHLLQGQNKSSETIFPFEYNQMQLRAQHPIEAIIESSESKISQIFENSEKEKSEMSSMTKILLKSIYNDSIVVKKTLKEALAKNLFAKDLICNFDWSKEEIGKTLSPIKSYVIRRQTEKRRGAPFAKKKQVPETVRSMVDLNSKTCRKRKGRKALRSRLRDTYLCYPFLQDLQDNSLKSIQESTEQIEEKNPTYISPNSSIKSTIQSNSEIHKKLSESFGFKRQKSEAIPSKPQTSDSKAEPTKTTVNQSSSNTVLYLNKERVSDCCSIELLLSENAENLFTLSVSNFSTKKDLNEKTSLDQIQSRTPDYNHEPEATLDKVNDPPIVLHPAKSDIDDLSFPSMIIHSDSFLKCFSGLPIRKSKLESLFKSDSDMKFYPGKILKNGSESKPLVTFVLTAKQKAMTVHSSDRIHVVTKPNVLGSPAAAPTLLPPSDQPEKKPPEIQPDKHSEKISFQPVEKFSESPKCRKRKIIMKKLYKNSNKKEQKNLTRISSSNHTKECFVNSQTSSSSHPVDRKAYHECQKKKKIPGKINIEVKKIAKMSEKAKENQKIKTVQRKGKLERSNSLFPNRVKDFIKALEIFEDNSNVENKESKKCKVKDTYLTAEAVNFNEKYCKPATNNVQNKVTYVDTETAAEEIVNSTKTLLNFLPDLLETLKTALTQSDFKNKAEIISIIENELKAKKPELCEVAVSTTETFDNSSILPKQLQAVKIKIYCYEHNCSQESKKAENSAQNLQTEKPDLLEEVRTVQVFPHEQAVNSLPLGEVKDGDLERQNSTYFDALEKTSQDETSRAGKEMGDSQKMYQRPLEGVLDLNAEFGVKEEKSQCHPLLTPSDEKLLFKDCFTKESEEEIIIKITKSLKENKIPYSMALLEEFLKKIEITPYHPDICCRLSQMLLLVENKSRNLMMMMEKNAWIKALSLLEELYQMFENEDTEGSMKGHLQMTRAFINKIQALNVSRLADLQNFCYILSQKSTTKNSGNHMGKVFNKMCESLNFLKQKFAMKCSCICKETENFTNYDYRNEDSESRYKAYSAISLPEICEKASQYKEENKLEYLKKQIKEQKVCIEQLIELDSDFVSQEFEDKKNEAVGEMLEL